MSPAVALVLAAFIGAALIPLSDVLDVYIAVCTAIYRKLKEHQ